MTKKAVCVISGGMDSTLSAKIAQNDGYEVIGVHYNYLQRTEQKELQAFRNVIDALNIKTKYEIDLPFFAGIGASALTDASIEVPTSGLSDGVPVTYVPFRNGLFLSAAASLALSLDCGYIYYGAHSDDAAGNAYPDCTEHFYKSMGDAIFEGSGKECSLEAPFINHNKADVVKEGLRLGVPYHLTWSCYEGGDKPCGHCGTCIDRAEAFRANGVEDPAQ